MIDAFEYLSYMSFLRDYLVEEKTKGRVNGRENALKILQQKRGLFSTEFITDIISKKDDSVNAQLEVLFNALHFSKKERVDFEYMVHNNRDKSEEEKKACFKCFISLSGIKNNACLYIGCVWTLF